MRARTVDEVDYEHVRVVRRDQVIEATLHSGDASLRWGRAPMLELGDFFGRIGTDPTVKVLVLAGTGGDFCAELETGERSMASSLTTPAGWDEVDSAGRLLMRNMLDMQCVVIAAVNGPARVHAEMAVLSDIVLAADSALFQDRVHFQTGGIPGDGSNFVWPALIGPNRSRYFLLTGQEISAREALSLGIVAEVLPADELLARANALADQMAAKPWLSIRHSRRLLTRELRRQAFDHSEIGLALEGLSLVQRELDNA